MELYIKDNVNDISYMSELTPPSKQNRLIVLGIEGGVQFAQQLTFISFRKLRAH